MIPAAFEAKLSALDRSSSDGTFGGERRAEGVPVSKLPLGGSIDEGAVFGGVFLSLALRVGLKEVVEALLASKMTNFGQFRTWFNDNRLSLTAELDGGVEAWGL